MALRDQNFFLFNRSPGECDAVRIRMHRHIKIEWTLLEFLSTRWRFEAVAISIKIEVRILRDSSSIFYSKVLPTKTRNFCSVTMPPNAHTSSTYYTVPLCSNRFLYSFILFALLLLQLLLYGYFMLFFAVHLSHVLRIKWYSPTSNIEHRNSCCLVKGENKRKKRYMCERTLFTIATKNKRKTVSRPE